jgi:multidrug efflux pump subunit AcrA (membrane-fusion protein)
MKKIFVLIVFAIILFGIVFAYRKFSEKHGIKDLETVQVKHATVRESLVETGILKQEVGAVVKIGARATGAIKEMRVKIGDTVKKGQLIALIDQREMREAIEQTERSIEGLENKIRQIELTYPARIREAEFSIAELTAAHQLASLDRKRKEELFQKGYISAQEKDSSTSAHDEAEARLMRSRQTLERLKDEFVTELSIQDAELHKSHARMNEQKVKLSYTSIYSPMDGVVSQVAAQEGETIVTGLQVANLVTVIDPERLEMWIYVDETDIGKVKLKQRVEYYVDAYPDATFTGTVDKVYPEPEIRDNIVYYLAIASVNKEYTYRLKPQMTTHVRIIVNEKSNLLAVPNSALRFEGGKQIVYLLQPDGGVQKREIKTGLSGESMTEVLTGLEEGDVVSTKIIIPVTGKRGARAR